MNRVFTQAALAASFALTVSTLAMGQSVAPVGRALNTLRPGQVEAVPAAISQALAFTLELDDAAPVALLGVRVSDGEASEVWRSDVVPAGQLRRPPEGVRAFPGNILYPGPLLFGDEEARRAFPGNIFFPGNILSPEPITVTGRLQPVAIGAYPVRALMERLPQIAQEASARGDGADGVLFVLVPVEQDADLTGIFVPYQY